MDPIPHSITLADPRELQALASIALEPKVQQRLDALLRQQAEGPLSDAATDELDTLLELIDRLSLVKAKALCALQDAPSA